METNTQNNTTRTHTLSKKNHLPYIELITSAADFISERERIPRTIADPIADFIIYVSFLHTETEWWTDTFTKARNRAEGIYGNPYDYWRLIARDLSTPKVERECLKILPRLRGHKYFSHLHSNAAAPIANNPTLPKQYRPPQTYWPERKTPAPTPTPRAIKTLVALPRIRRGLRWRLDDRWDELSPSTGRYFSKDAGAHRNQREKTTSLGPSSALNPYQKK